MPITGHTELDNPSTSKYIEGVSVKPPPFWNETPKLWFAHIEAQFKNSNVSAEITKYNITVAALEQKILNTVSDIVLSPPEETQYTAIIEALIARLSDSESVQLKMLFSELDLGDKRPSQLLREMRNLAIGKVNDNVLKPLWLQQLPQQVQAILAVSTEALDKLAEMGDKILETCGRYQCVGEFSANTNPGATKSESLTLSTILDKINELSKEVRELRRSRSTSRNRNHLNRRSSNYRNRSKSREGICWYHRRFGKKSTRCTKPCSFVADFEKSEN
ncbi:uncharacterized protein [Parasteatoda tepidariorum]|uniref:uncharacterized protein n=1 Tax=Parasteatoda tepidariorum TaxID=114398 RepID=UPI001C723A77|nr:uncharacterized protein LOC122269108 [Parasteatoda tepidariorum]